MSPCSSLESLLSSFALSAILLPNEIQKRTNNTREVFIKHQRGRHKGTWEISQYTVHMTGQGGRPYCKNGHPDCLPDGRLSPRGWRQQSNATPDQVSCKMCLQLLARDAIETTLSPALTIAHEVSPIALHWATKLRQATSLRQAHQCLAFACVSCLTDEEIMTYRNSGLFTISQCLRFLRLLHASGQRFDRTLIVRTLMRFAPSTASAQLRAWVESDEGQRIWLAKETLPCLERICHALDHTQVFIYGLLIVPHFFTILSMLDQETFTRLLSRYVALANTGLCFWWDGAHLACCPDSSAFFAHFGVLAPAPMPDHPAPYATF